MKALATDFGAFCAILGPKTYLTSLFDLGIRQMEPLGRANLVDWDKTGVLDKSAGRYWSLEYPQSQAEWTRLQDSQNNSQSAKGI
jgi:hypothetical protein